jgi:anti-anti-sigma regulatory factor
VFTSQSLRSVVRPGDLAVREQRLDDVVHQMDLKGSLDDGNAPELERRIDAALAGGVRWLIVDLAEANPVGDEALNALSNAVRELRSRRGELIVAGASDDVAGRLAAFDVAHRPALAANVDQAVMILKMLRPKTDIRHPGQRAKQRITSLTLPRIEPPANPA